jgi:hypothetical protein
MFENVSHVLPNLERHWLTAAYSPWILRHIVCDSDHVVWSGLGIVLDWYVCAPLSERVVADRDVQDGFPLEIENPTLPMSSIMCWSLFSPSLVTDLHLSERWTLTT